MSVRVAITTDADVVTARQEARAMGGDLGFTQHRPDAARHRDLRGRPQHHRLRRRGRGRSCAWCAAPAAATGIEVSASDEGPGIANVELALQDGYTTGNGLGLGLPGARRLVDEFELDTAPGEGTTVRLVKWGRADG